MTDLHDLEHGTDLGTALETYDRLAPVTVAQLRGWWRGTEIPTGHPLDGALTAYGWWGKWFAGPEDAHPLVFRAQGGGTYEVDPARLPLGVGLRVPPLLRARMTANAFRALRPALQTRRPRGRLRMLEHRGVVSAALVYDHQPIVDTFRAVDPDTLVGVMDLRGMPPYLFSLRRSTAMVESSTI
ncbi:DUF4334 domain-containing protein [Arsenicicoccus bolidensis]|uniref:DUF4334 domain-containing protein n=1 Tax=Arsenicicoccus bolidensis TaxID=229480 RepID=UPI0028AC328A|nr:DUF4334 domain-containing protein [Arsenicicoccus bolidensis]